MFALLCYEDKKLGTDWEKILANVTSHKRFIPGICKELSKPNSKEKFKQFNR